MWFGMIWCVLIEAQSYEKDKREREYCTHVLSTKQLYVNVDEINSESFRRHAISDLNLSIYL